MQENNAPRYTTIIHEVRIAMDLNMTEYCVADLIFALSSNPSSRIPGWCFSSREEMRNFLGIAKRTLLNNIERLIEKGLVEREEKTKYLKTTPLWYDSVVIERLKMRKEGGGAKSAPGVQKVHQEVQKVHRGGAKSAPPIYVDKNIDNNNDKNTISGFYSFWEKYPNKTAKKKALEMWNRLKPDESLRTTIMAALESHIQSERWAKGFIPHPATWIYQERWTEVLEKAKDPEKKLYFQGNPVVEKNGKKYVIENGQWLLFAGKQSELELR